HSRRRLGQDKTIAPGSHGYAYGLDADPGATQIICKLLPCSMMMGYNLQRWGQLSLLYCLRYFP
ncbi:MAG TPA: hypothetical protein PKW69_11380, partial [Niabella sp.]|nr:hypothetical protein [Niabella sp.]